jgi:hypothetical protein
MFAANGKPPPVPPYAVAAAGAPGVIEKMNYFREREWVWVSESLNEKRKLDRS